MGRRMQPLVLCAYEVDVEPVLDTADRLARTSHGVGDHELDCPNWRLELLSGRTPASHVLADRLIAAGFAGMRVKSYARGAGDRDVNLVLWRWGTATPIRVTLIDEEDRLERFLRAP